MSGRCFDPFRILSPAERADHLQGYRTYLLGRDGQIDLPRQRLTRREAWLDDLDEKPVGAVMFSDCNAVDLYRPRCELHLLALSR